MTPKDVLEMIKEKEARVVDLRFLDFPGVWQHFTVPVSELDESSFEDGFGFDGSSIRGWQQTLTRDSCQDLKRRLIWHIPAATAVRRYEFLCTLHHPKLSE